MKRAAAVPMLWCLLFLPFHASLLHAQDRSVTLTLVPESAQPLAIAGIQRNSTTYASLSDIGKALSTRVIEKDGLLTVMRNSGAVTFFADNPFAVVTDPAGKKTPVQLPANVIRTEGVLFIPVAATVPFFGQLFDITATFEFSTGTIRFDKRILVKPAFDITSLGIDPKANGVVIRIAATRPLALHEVLLKDDGWLYVTLPNAKADLAAIRAIKPSDPVRKILPTQFPTSVQLAFKLEGKFASSEIVKDDNSNDLLVTVRSLSEATMAAIEEKKKAGITEELERHRKKYDLDVIVLDAGHGGKDPGTIGVTGTKEKDVALGIVLKLGKLIEENLKGVDVVYTRKTDTFVELDKRGQLANERNGKLFISIHCNAMPRKPYPRRGFEVYLLRPGRTDEAISIAERENSVIELEEGYEQRYKKLTDENFILVTMAQTAHMRASEKFAEITTKELSKRVDTPNNGVKQAGFLVLVGSAMPNVLIETAYLSNREDEKLLKSQAGQEKYAEAIFSSIKRYKADYEKLLDEGRDFGQR